MYDNICTKLCMYIYITGKNHKTKNNNRNRNNINSILIGIPCIPMLPSNIPIAPSLGASNLCAKNSSAMIWAVSVS